MNHQTIPHGIMSWGIFIKFCVFCVSFLRFCVILRLPKIGQTSLLLVNLQRIVRSFKELIDKSLFVGYLAVKAYGFRSALPHA